MKGFYLSLTSLICLFCSANANINTFLYLSHQDISGFSNSIDDFKSISTEDVHSMLYLSSYSENMNSYKSNIQSKESLKFSYESIYNSINSYSYYDSFNEPSFSEPSFSEPSFSEPSLITPSFSQSSFSQSSFSQSSFSQYSLSESSFHLSHIFPSIDDDYNTKDDDNISDDNDKIENYNSFVKVDLDIIGESKASFDILKQQIFINGVSIIVSINSKLIWFDSITDIFIQQRYLRKSYRTLIQQGVNTILGIAVNDNQGTNVVTSFKNSVDDGTFINILQSNGLTLSLNINNITVVSSPNLTTDDDDNNENPVLSDDTITNDLVDVNKEAVIGIASSGGFMIFIFAVIYIRKIRNKIKPEKNMIPFTSISIGNTLNLYKPYFKKHNPSVINISDTVNN